MGLKLNRNKKRHFLLSILYRIHKILPLSHRAKLSLYLDLEWIFDRLAHEESFRNYEAEQHPIRIHTLSAILEKVSDKDNVLDLGCKYGDLTYYISEKANLVVGIDFDAIAIEKAKSSYQRDNLTFEIVDAHDFLQKSTTKFNVLILSHILEHIDDPLSFLKMFANQFSRIYIELPDYNKTYLNEYRAELQKNLSYTDPDHVSEFDRYELENLIVSSGLKIEKARYIFGIQQLWCVPAN